MIGKAMFDWLFCDVFVWAINTREFGRDSATFLILLLIPAFSNRKAREAYKGRYWLAPFELFNFRRNWAIATVATITIACWFFAGRLAEICD